MNTTVKAAAVYARISRDRAGERLGVDRQERLCRELADRKGWTVAEVYTDNDLSAYTGRRRPAYERMLADLEAGARDAVICVDADRLTRHPRELETFIDLADRFGVPLANVSGDLDLSTSDGRLRARIMGAVARQESEKKADRLRREREERAQEGKPHPGPRAFGYRTGNMTLDETEADLIRRAAADVLARRSLRSIADQWNAAGVTTTRGRPWTVSAVRDVLTRERNVARRRHQGAIVGDAAWPAILDVDTWERVRAIAHGRKRGVGRPPNKLLSGILRCSICGGPMNASTSRGVRTYACRRVVGSTRDGNCGRLSIVADKLDDLVRDAILHRLTGSDLLARVAQLRTDRDHHALVTALRADEEHLDELETDYYVDRAMSKAGYLRARAQLQARIDRARRQLEAAETVGVLATVPTGAGADVPGWWSALGDDGRRQVVELLLERIEVLPAEGNAPRRLDPARIPPDRWRWRV